MGPAREWPAGLQNISAFVESLQSAAAMFVGHDLVMLQNKPWAQLLGTPTEQGGPLKDVVPEELAETLRSAMNGDVPSSMTVQAFDVEGRQHLRDWPVLYSPFTVGEANGIVVQVIHPQGEQQNADNQCDSGCHIGGHAEQHMHEMNPSKGNFDSSPTNQRISLDRQPFFQKFAEMLPTGLAILDHQAEALFVNQQFHELTVHGGTDKSFKKWPKTIHPQDYDRVMNAYREAFESRTDLSTEFRAYGKEEPWRLFLMRPLEDENLEKASLKRYGGFICAVVDITKIKAAELSEKKAARDAQERKRQQERFIDMLSHEIRNPLGAVLHCQEDILEAIDYGKIRSDTINVDDIVEACETISICVGHQKTLVDDVLSFSKLDASMLSLAPKDTQPKRQMADSLKIFQPELRKRHIGFDYQLDPSYNKHKVEWVKADLVRISQVLVNLMTNSIKFTAKKEGPKKIAVDVGASIERPTSYPPDVVYFELDDQVTHMDSTHSAEWGNGEALYITVAIRDTGIGISNENQTKLFDRFRQATPKTEEIYGGSGLGLNISRKICQLHGGEIGVSSKEGSGSTFAFFFRVRRCETTPPDGASMNQEEMQNGLHIPEEIQQKDLKDKDVPESLKSPRVEPSSNNDDRWSHTADIVSNIPRKPDIDQNGKNVKDKDGDTSRNRRTQLTDRTKGDQPFLKILFVEDNLINQKILKRKMQSKGFEVVTANNGKDAVESYKAAIGPGATSPAFDCVLMDQEMPIMDGNAATKAIREYETENSLPRVRIIGVSANVRQEQQADMKTAGMDSVLSKPFKIDELVSRIREVSKEAENKT
ncbi:hypothetical protein AAFC00_005002 [Neodothiora populina]